MRSIKVMNSEEVIKYRDDLFGPIQERVMEMVMGAMRGMKASLEAELSGIALVVMQTVMELEIAQIAGKKHKHQKDREYTRWGKNPGSVVIDGTKVPCTVPRALEVETKKAYQVKSYGLFRQAGQLLRRAYQDLIRGISTRRYKQGVSKFLEGYGASAPTLSRRMVQVTATKVKELLERRLEELELVVLMIDGVRVAHKTVIVALGIDTEGVKHIVGLRQGATENARVVTNLLEDLVERGLSIKRPLLVVMDGSKALRRAVEDVLGKETPVQRCTVHKKRNVLDELPEQYHRHVGRRITRAYNLVSEDEARKELSRLAEELEAINPSAARSLLEGLEETLTLHRLGVPEALRKSLQSTNLIESAIAVVRQAHRNVKRWRDGKQIERWIAAGLLEAEKNFRKVKGYGAMKSLVNALQVMKTKQGQVA